MNMQKMKPFYEVGRVSSSRTNSMKVKEHYAYKTKPMSKETQDFIKKICYRKTASIDMTQHGFINDSKINPVNYVMKPLREQLVKICVKPAAVAVKRSVRNHYSSVLPRSKLSEAVTATEQRPHCIPTSVKPVVVKRQYLSVLPRNKLCEAVTSTERKPPFMPKSALSRPGNRPLRTRCRVRIQSEPIPDSEAEEKKGKLVTPSKNKAVTTSRKK